MNNRPIYLISCSSKKNKTPQKASTLYASPLFEKSVAYVRLIDNNANWFVLSAKHHLIHPETIIEPYDESLSDKSASEKKRWGEIVYKQITDLGYQNSHFVFLTGNSYSMHLKEYIIKGGGTVEEPMAGLGIGQRLKWLNKNLGK